MKCIEIRIIITIMRRKKIIILFHTHYIFRKLTLREKYDMNFIFNHFSKVF